MARNIATRSFLFTSFVAVGFWGCASSLSSLLQPPTPAYPTVQIQDDQFEKFATLVGVDSVAGSDYANYHRYLLRTYVDKETLSYLSHLYVKLNYRGDWHFFQNASSEDAISLEFESISRDVVDCSGRGNCILSETFAAWLEEDVLELGRGQGYSVKFRARSGSELVVRLSPEQIDAQLEAVSAYVADAVDDKNDN